MPVGPLETKVFQQDRVQFTYKWKTAVSHGIWQNFLQKTVGASNNVA